MADWDKQRKAIKQNLERLRARPKHLMSKFSRGLVPKTDLGLYPQESQLMAILARTSETLSDLKSDMTEDSDLRRMVMETITFLEDRVMVLMKLREKRRDEIDERNNS